MKSADIPRVVVFPSYADNPFSSLLLDSTRAVGYTVEATTTLAEYADRVATLKIGDVLHVQWTGAVTRGLAPAEASRRVDAFTRVCSAALARGVAVIWTIHNVIAHDSTQPDQEVALARYLAEAATAIHVINPYTPVAVHELYPLPPEKITVIPHSSYAGVYPEGPDRAAARRSFGIRGRQRVVLFFGQPRRYKGADILRDAISLLKERERAVVLLSSPTRIADSDVARWFAAADVIALPYRAALNSGTVQLAATFGVPAIIPDLPGLLALHQDQPWVHFYPHAGGAPALASAIASFAPAESDRSAALSFAAAASPRQMSDSFRDLVEATRLARLESTVDTTVQ